MAGAMGAITHMTLVQILVFASLIVAVDPVAVSCGLPFSLYIGLVLSSLDCLDAFITLQ